LQEDFLKSMKQLLVLLRSINEVSPQAAAACKEMINAIWHLWGDGQHIK
jgi:hypothetical protein